MLQIRVKDSAQPQPFPSGMGLSVIGKVGLNNKIIFNIRLIQVVYENLKLKLPDFSGFSWPNFDKLPS